MDVRLGPSWFLDQQKLVIQKGDAIDLAGSMIKYADGQVMLAQWVKKSDATVQLRDAEGYPMWAGWRRP